MRYLTSRLLCLGLVIIALTGLQTVRSQEKKGVQFDGQVELMYRNVDVSGSRDKYNYDFAGLDSGTRIGNTFLQWDDIDSGALDYARIDLLGLGGEPYEFAGLKLGRKDSYDLRFSYSSQRYVYDLFDVTNDLDGNAWNTDNRRTGLDLTINATSNIDVLVQYHDQERTGPGRELRRVIDGEFFLMDRPVDFRVQRFGAGVDATVGKTRIYFLQEHRKYEDQQDFFTRFNTGIDTTNTTFIDSLTWVQNDEGDANLTTLNVLTPLGQRVNLAASFYGTFFGEEEINSRVEQNASGTDSGAPFSWTDGFSSADIKQETLLGEIDLSVAIIQEFGIRLQFRSLSQDADSEGTEDLTGTGTTTGLASDYEYSLSTATILLEGQPTGRFKVTLGYRLADRELNRSASRSQSGGRNQDFESKDDQSGVLALSWRPLGWMHFRGQFEKGKIDRPFTTVSPHEVDYGRVSAGFNMPGDTHLDLSYGKYKNRQDALQFGSEAESDVGSISFWQNVGSRFDYTIRYSMQDIDNETQTATSLDANALSIFKTDNSSIFARLNTRVTQQWSFFVRLLYTRSDGSNPFLGTNFEAAVSPADVQAAFDQENVDGEAGVKYQFAGGPFVGFSLRAFDYSDTLFTGTDYDGTIGTFTAGFTF